MLETAIRAAREAGRALLDAAAGDIEVDSLAERDVKLAEDRRAEEVIISVLRQRFPDHAILSEECGRLEGDSEYTWIVDPLDGTHNFFRRIPVWCTSIGLRRGDEGVMGVVYDPVRDEMFSAERGKGAQMNGAPVRVSETAELLKATLAFGMGLKAGGIETTMRALAEIAPKSARVRELGAAAIHLAYVACGRADGFFQFGLREWDVAAGLVLVREAGGVAETKSNAEGTLDVVASNGAIHSRLVEEIGWRR